MEKEDGSVNHVTGSKSLSLFPDLNFDLSNLAANELHCFSHLYNKCKKYAYNVLYIISSII